MIAPDLRAEVIQLSALGAAEVAIWYEMLAASPHLQRAFFTPAFALACERTTGLAYVAVVTEGATIRAFLPFQFRTAWHRRIRLAQRIGGGLSDNAGLIAWPDFRITATRLLRLCGLAALNLNHIMDGQDRFGLDVNWSDIGYVTDLTGGPDAYFTDLLTRNRDFVRDTERRQRKIATSYGPMVIRETDRVTKPALAGVVAMKRQHYQRTQVADAFEAPGNLRLIETLRQSPVPECGLVLATLEAGDMMLAQHLGLRHHRILSWWFPVYDVSAQGVSPGRLLLWQMIRNATESGVGLIDYGAGEAQYKRQFSTTTLRMGRAVWSAANARSLLAQAWQSMEWRLRASSRPNAEPG
ncbi:MAG TPA: GNAT family N-acetyltransferase [Acetobacteraceae bacterium]|nr:GNAT family N-acetyltransferase [Acetobacteraceae bacterium]